MNASTEILPNEVPAPNDSESPSDLCMPKTQFPMCSGDVDDVEVLETRGDAEFPVPWRKPIRFVGWLIRTVFGAVSLVLMLAVIAAIPIVNFFALGYLLEVEGRVARTGKFRNAFPLFRDAPRIGSIALGIWLFLLPLRILGSAAADARLIDPGSPMTIGLSIGLQVAWCLITVHLVLALARGGSIWCFVRPLKNLLWFIQRLRTGDYLETVGKHVGEFVHRMRIKHHFSLGFRGFAVAMLWLVIPTLLYAAVRRPVGPQVLMTILGGVLLTITLSWAPFLQARFAAENGFRSGLQLREIRSLYRYAPLAWTLATVVVYLLALPLYLFKAFLLPPDAMWPITLIFVLSIYPTKVITGWAYHHAVRLKAEEKLAHWSLRWGCNTVLIPLLGVYVFILYFTQFLGEQGKLVLFHHHALLLPAPFQGTINP